MSLSASSDSPLMSAASPTTTAIRSSPWRRSRASASPSAIDRPVPACPPSNTSCADSDRRGKPADAVELAQRAEALEPAGQQLVRVGLVAGVPDDPVARRLEQPVERDRQLDDAERRAEVAAGARHGLHDRVADLDRQLRELDLVEPTQVGGLLDGGQDRHGYGAPGSDRGGSAGSVGLTSRADSHVMIGSCPRRSRMGRASQQCKPVPHRSLVSSTTTVNDERCAWTGSSSTGSAPTLGDRAHDAGRCRLRRRPRRRSTPRSSGGRPRSCGSVDDDDVVAAVVAAGDLGLPIAVRGGGHSVAGHAMADGALVVDMRDLRAVRVDPRRRIVRVDGGALWEDVDSARLGAPSRGRRRHVRRHGRRPASTLGGGIGWLSGLRGLHLRQPGPSRARDRGRRARRGRSGRRSGPALGAARRWRQLRRRDGVRVPRHRPGSDPGRLHPVPAPCRVEQVLRRLARWPRPRPDALELTAHDRARRRGRPAPRSGSASAGRATRRPATDVLRPLRAALPADLDTVGPMDYPAIQAMSGRLPFGFGITGRATSCEALDESLIDGDRRGDGRAAGQPQLHPARGHPRAGACRSREDGAAFGQRAATLERERPRRSGTTRPRDDPHIAWARETADRIAVGSLSGAGYANYAPVDETNERVRLAFGTERFARLARSRPATTRTTGSGSTSTSRPAPRLARD